MLIGGPRIFDWRGPKDIFYTIGTSESASKNDVLVDYKNLVFAQCAKFRHCQCQRQVRYVSTEGNFCPKTEARNSMNSIKFSGKL